MDDTAAPRHARWPFGLLLLAIVGVAAFLRFNNLGDASIWWDESATWRQASGTFAEVFSRTATDTYPPGYNLLVWIAFQFAGISEWSLRLPAAILGTLNVLAVFWVGRIFGGNRAGIIAALFLALSPFAVGYSHDARMYTLLALSATLLLGATASFVLKPGWGWAIAAVLSGVALLYSHPYGAFSWISIAAAAGIVMLIERRPFREIAGLVLTQLAILLVFIPWLLVLVGVSHRLGADGFWLPRPTLTTLLVSFSRISGDLGGLLLVVIGILLLALPRRRLLSASGGSRLPPMSILVAAALGPIVLGFVISQVTTPVFLTRYLSGAMPALVVLAALGIATLAATWPRMVVAGVAIVVVFAGVFTANPRLNDENWRGVARYLTKTLQPTDCLLLIDASGKRTLDFYFDRYPQCFATDVKSLLANPGLAGAPHVYYVKAHTTKTVRQVSEAIGIPRRSKNASIDYGALRLGVMERK